MDRHHVVDPYLEKDITRLLVCAPEQCTRESSCFRVARFARDKIRAMYKEDVIDNSNYEGCCESNVMRQLYSGVGSWESA